MRVTLPIGKVREVNSLYKDKMFFQGLQLFEKTMVKQVVKHGAVTFVNQFEHRRITFIIAKWKCQG